MGADLVRALSGYFFHDPIEIAVDAVLAGAILALVVTLLALRRLKAGGAISRAGVPKIESKLLSIAEEMFSVHDTHGMILQAAGAVETITGVSASAVIGLRLDDFVHLDDRLAVLALWGRLSVGDVVPKQEFRLVRPDGRIVWVEASISALGEKGGHAKFACAMGEVTRRRLAETELDRIRHDLSTFLAAGQGALYRLGRKKNRKWQASFVAANIERITGHTVADAMTPDWPDNLLSLPNRMLRWGALHQAIESGSGTAEYDLPAPDGTVIRVRDFFRRWDRLDGTIEIVGYIVDISEVHSTDLRLRQAQEEIAANATAGPGFLYRIVVKSPEDQRIVFVSQNVSEFLDFTAEEIKAPGWLTPEMKRAQWERIRPAIHRGISSSSYRYQDRNGKSRWCRDTVRYVHGSHRQHDLVGYWVDVTEEKERATQLAQASKLATLGEMATSLSHELSQPLASISMAAENALLSLLASPANLGTLEKKLGRISQQALRAAKLIDHMLIFGRREKGELQPISLAKAIEGALLIMGGRLRKTKVAIICNIEPRLPNVLASRVLVEQVIINLIANACDAFISQQPLGAEDRRKIEITVGAKGGLVVLSVADHAGGVPSSELSKVFEPFFTTKPAGQGTGLGLSISYGIISDMGGTMTAYNTDDGAVFELRLPEMLDNQAHPTALNYAFEQAGFEPIPTKGSGAGVP